MYSLEQRTRTVELYIRYGLKAAATTRELEQPKCTAKLAEWIDEHALGCD